MIDVLAVGDRVCCRGFEWKKEPTRIGVVVELYRGLPSAVTPGIELVAVRWNDTGAVERGFIRSTGSLTKLPADAASEAKEI